MKNCIGCKYAEWETTKVGRLHPSGDGRCNYQYKLPPPPNSIYFMPIPDVRRRKINRRTKYIEDCAYYGRG